MNTFTTPQQTFANPFVNPFVNPFGFTGVGGPFGSFAKNFTPGLGGFGGFGGPTPWSTPGAWGGLTPANTFNPFFNAINPITGAAPFNAIGQTNPFSMNTINPFSAFGGATTTPFGGQIPGQYPFGATTGLNTPTNIGGQLGVNPFGGSAMNFTTPNSLSASNLTSGLGISPVGFGQNFVNPIGVNTLGWQNAFTQQPNFINPGFVHPNFLNTINPSSVYQTSPFFGVYPTNWQQATNVGATGNQTQSASAPISGVIGQPAWAYGVTPACARPRKSRNFMTKHDGGPTNRVAVFHARLDPRRLNKSGGIRIPPLSSSLISHFVTRPRLTVDSLVAMSASAWRSGSRLWLASRLSATHAG